MKIVIAMDKFKGGLSASDACRCVAEGLHQVEPAVCCVEKPMADGGEGTAAALMATRPGSQWIPVTVAGPLPNSSVAAGFAWFPDDQTAVIEMAAASGLALVPAHERNPLLTTTYGTGQLLLEAARRGARRILLTIGGSATVDGGTGAAAALGWRFLDRNGRDLTPVGGGLLDICSIVPPAARLLPPVTVLCDVTNPLCGPQGAAVVFGPQKGATPAMVATLDAGLQNLAEIFRTQLGRDLTDLPDGGAAGGLGAGAVAFFDADLAPGIATVIAATRLDHALIDAAWCITGEGSFDSQSLAGKVISGVAAAAQQTNVPVVVIAGRVDLEPATFQPHGIHTALATHSPEMPLDDVMKHEAELLRAAAAKWMRGISNQ